MLTFWLLFCFSINFITVDGNTLFKKLAYIWNSYPTSISTDEIKPSSVLLTTSYFWILGSFKNLFSTHANPTLSSFTHITAFINVVKLIISMKSNQVNSKHYLSSPIICSVWNAFSNPCCESGSRLFSSLFLIKPEVMCY